MRAKFPFNDLHSFKDYVGFVKLCAPDLFPEREGLGKDDQWTLDLAFQGLREGMDLAVSEKRDRPAFAQCRVLVEEAKAAYSAQRLKDGFLKLDDVQKILKSISTQ